MTIREKFANYTTEEIKAGIERLKEKIADEERCMKEFKEEKNVEMFRAAKELYDQHFDSLLDAECALTARIK